MAKPFPLGEADAHLARIARWGFNCLRLLVTWEAIEHEGPGRYDAAYLDYVAAVARRAEAHGFVLFIDMHQDVWSRMTGGDGAPGWVFGKLGLDFTRFDAAGAANVMQYRYDPAGAEARQEDAYPMMSWARNYRLPANGLIWTAFFAGALLTPEWRIDGENVQHYLQRHYLGAMAALAERLTGNPAVIGFDTLNEPSPGWIGQAMSAPQLAATREAPIPVRAGPCWTPFAALQAASGRAVTLPVLAPGADGAMEIAGEEVANPGGVSIWVPGAADPYAVAGAWTGAGEEARVLDEDFFRIVDGRAIDPDTDLLLPFFQRIADTLRAIDPDWLLFAEVNPYQLGHGRGFPADMPERCVNASHWYDVGILWKKRFDAEAGPAALRARYIDEIGALFDAADPARAMPRLMGEFGIPFDLDEGRAYARWAAGRRDEAIWAPHVAALTAMYDALDALGISSTQWNYTASNRNDLRIGDGWNQEDLSIFSPDQVADGGDGARALKGFARPYVRRAQGRIAAMRFDAETGLFEARIDVDPAIAAPSEIVVPEAHFPDDIAVTIDPRGALDLRSRKPAAADRGNRAGGDRGRCPACRGAERGAARGRISTASALNRTRQVHYAGG
ncbi:cellulase family glycosylhydrolase [Sphingopyxis sp. PET50]|uniref:glycoside hydrolase family 5 protein n=1 Tax=Sphingopyxis sp. PET50 TaxID=2976533 RepID=UPI0021AECB1F|nr:cellulase family glycosylhydrolase [Sphingopyxis sp. PET50]